MHVEANRAHPVFGWYIKNNLWPTTEQDNQIELIHWYTYDISKLATFTIDIPIMDLITDKAVAPTRDAWDQLMDGCDKNRHPENRQPLEEKMYAPKQPRRLIERFLREQNEDVLADIVQSYEERGQLNEEDQLFVLSLKELELNKGRGFCIQTLKSRLLQGLREKKLADHVMDKIVYQSMTMSGVDSDHRLATLSGFHKNSPITGTYVVYISIDFSKWNSRFRFSNTAATFGAYDEFFGENRKKQHNAFSTFITNLMTDQIFATALHNQTRAQLGAYVPQNLNQNPPQAADQAEEAVAQQQQPNAAPPAVHNDAAAAQPAAPAALLNIFIWPTLQSF